MLFQVSNRFIGRRHIGNFHVELQTVLYHLLCVIQIDFILRCARHDHIHFFTPRFLSFEERNTEFFRVILYAVPAGCPHFQHKVDFFRGGNTVFIVNITVRSGNRNHFAAQLIDLLYRPPCHISESGNCKRFSLNVFAVRFQHLHGVIYSTESGCLRTDQRAAVRTSLTGQDTGKFIAQSLILTEQIADLSCSDADITGRNVGIRTDVFCQFGHKTLTKAHHFPIGFSFRIKIGAAFTAAHRKSRQGIFERLLKSEELNNTFVYGRMEPQSALIGTDRTVELHTEAAIDLHFAVVIYPRHTEFDDPLRLNHHINNAFFDVYRILFYNRL